MARANMMPVDALAAMLRESMRMVLRQMQVVQGDKFPSAVMQSLSEAMTKH